MLKPIVAHKSTSFPTGVYRQAQRLVSQYLLEQWSLTGGRQSSLAMSVFLIFRASSTCVTTRTSGSHLCWPMNLWRVWGGHSPTCPSPTRWPKNSRRLRNRSQMSWIARRWSCRFRLPGSETAQIFAKDQRGLFKSALWTWRSVASLHERWTLLTWSFITSPHAGAPTSPVPTFLSFLFREPTFLGFS